MRPEPDIARLAEIAPTLHELLTRDPSEELPALRVSASDIRRETTWMTARDGVHLATEVYLPTKLPAPALAVRTPYGRGALEDVFVSFARRGYVVVCQDCRGTGDSEPDVWDFFIYEKEDSHDLVDWIVRRSWFDGFIGSCGGSYLGSTQWAMAMHPSMSTIVPEVAGLCVIPSDEPGAHMFQHAYSRSVGKGRDKVPIHFSELERLMMEETLATGYFNEPLHPAFREELLERYPHLRTIPANEAKHWLFEQFQAMEPAGRAELVRTAQGQDGVTAVGLAAMISVFGHRIPFGLYILPHANRAGLARSLRAPALLIAGWYDWGLRDALATWALLRREAEEPIRSRCRLLITPAAHNMTGYHEGADSHPELRHNHRTQNNVTLLLHWYEAVRNERTDGWPTVIYYLMGANEWRVATDWPVPEARMCALYLAPDAALVTGIPTAPSECDSYIYNPADPTPTRGGSIVSYVYPPGSVDVSEIQQRDDVLVYTTRPLEAEVEVVGPLRLVLYASSDAIDTDFAARLSDVFPDGRAIQLQNGVLRARYREEDEPTLLEPDRVYRFELDLWATANLFKAGHRLRLDISSADFPRFDRNANRGGVPGAPCVARQTIYRDARRPSHLLLPILRGAIGAS